MIVLDDLQWAQSPPSGAGESNRYAAAIGLPACHTWDMDKEAFLARLEANRQIRRRYGIVFLAVIFVILIVHLPIASYFEKVQTAIWQDWIYGLHFFGILIGSPIIAGHLIDAQIRKLGLVVLCPVCGKRLDEVESARIVKQTGQCKHCKSQII